MSLASLSIKRPMFITSIMVVMLILGGIFMSRMSVDMFPDINFPFVSITTIYPGAGPKELETLVSKPLEEQMSSISGLQHVSSINQDSISIVFGEFTLESDFKYAEQQVKDKLAQARNRLPKDIQEPIVRRFDPSDRPTLSFSLTADLPPVELFNLADITIRNSLEQVKNVSKVDIIGGTKREIRVELDREKLKEYETSITMISGRIAGNSQNIPIGNVSVGSREVAFRSVGEFNLLDQIRNVVVSFYANDVPVTLDKLGKVIDSSQEVKSKGYLNGKTALLLDIYKQSGSNTVGVSDEIQKRMKKINEDIKGLKGSPKLNLVKDNATPIRRNIKDMSVTIFEGILLAIIVVYLFLGNFRSTFITAMALPNSLIGAFIFMGLAGFSINMLTLMALSLAVGLLIDDAIVVRENIFRHVQEGMEPVKAAKFGTNEVALAVIATSLTVIAVFLPVGFLQGIVGQFFKQFGLTVVFAMVISLFDSLTIAPMLSAYMIGKVDEEKRNHGIRAIIYAPARWFNVFYAWFERFYETTIKYTLKHKILILFLAVVIFIGSLVPVFMNKIPMTFMPKNEFGEFIIDLEAAQGTSLSRMDKYAVEIDELLRKEKNIKLVSMSVGNSMGESNVAELFIELVPEKERKRSTSDMKEYVRKLLAPYKETLNPSVNDIGMAAGQGKPFTMIISGENLVELGAIADNIKEKFKKIPGLIDVDTSYKTGKPEYQIKMIPAKMVKLGVQSVTAGMELRGMVEGMIPAKYRENGLEYDIRVKLQDSQRDLSREFGLLYVPNVNYQLVKLKNVADPIMTTGPSVIERYDRSRYIEIFGNLDKTGAVGTIKREAKKIMEAEKLPEGVSYEFVGTSEMFEDLIKNMIIAAGLSIIFIYLVLASLYESLIIPFTIMLALPLSTIGGLIALFITHQQLSMFTMIGLIMLLGLAAKNSILLIDYTQRMIRRGMKRDDAIIRAGVVRLRPILMTSFALIAGMLPLALGLTEMGKFRQSMGIAVIGGLISSTFLTLVVIPAVFGYMDDLRLGMRKLLKRPESREIDKAEEITAG